MSQDSFQEALFEDPIGLRFRHARERKRWSVESAAQQLRLPVAVIDAIEREDWPRLGAPIYARSYVGTYARLLGLPPELADEVVRGRPTPALVQIGSLPSQRGLDRRGLRIAALALAGVAAAGLAAAFWFGLPSADRLGLGGVRAAAAPERSALATESVPAPASVPEPAAAPPAAAAAQAADATPVAPSVPGELLLRFRGESWIEVLGPGGTTVERGLVAAGSERRFAPGQLSQLTLGDATAVDLWRDGVAQDLGTAGGAKIARFTVSSGNNLQPAAID